MNHLTSHDLTTAFLALAVVLAVARFAGEVVRRVGQPSILGEIGSGIVLGPSILGHLKPEWYKGLFPATGAVPLVMDTMATTGLVFFLLAAGLQTRLQNILQQGKRALFVSLFGGAVPFATGFLAADLFPSFLGAEQGSHRLVFALFIATALSISALPVIAKTLMDLKLLETTLGSLVISAATFDDLFGWILFGLVTRLFNSTRLGVNETTLFANAAWEAVRTILLVVAFVFLTLTCGRWLIEKIIRTIRRRTRGRGGVLSFIFSLAFAAAAFAEHTGVQAAFGVFIVAIALGDSLAGGALPEDNSVYSDEITYEIRQIATNLFAPFFFASISLHTDFVTSFNLEITVALILVACTGKLLGAGLGARMGGMDARSSCAVGLAMNSRGAMEIVLALVALRNGLIAERMFVALVILALFTSLISGPAIQALMRQKSADDIHASAKKAGVAVSTEAGEIS